MGGGYTPGVIMSLRLAIVHGPSMVPTLRHGDRVLVRSGTIGTPVGRVVLVELPDRPLSVKRLMSVEPDGTVRVEGDNPYGSTDSRTLGALPASAITGVVLGRLWPKPRRF
jgi:phage repressor protein C with HTH and peptisase S24 domain